MLPDFAKHFLFHRYTLHTVSCIKDRVSLQCTLNVWVFVLCSNEETAENERLSNKWMWE